jgi:hypothetical protein
MSEEYVCLKIPSYYPTERIKDSTEGGLWVISRDVWISIQKLIKSHHWNDEWPEDDIEVYENPNADIISFVQKMGNKHIYDRLGECIRSHFESNGIHREFLDRNLHAISNEYTIDENQISWDEWVENVIDEKKSTMLLPDFGKNPSYRPTYTSSYIEAILSEDGDYLDLDL